MRAVSGCSSRAPIAVRVRRKYPPGYSFSKGVLPTTCPSISTVASGGVLVIFSVSAGAAAQESAAQSAAPAHRIVREEDIGRAVVRDDPAAYYHVTYPRANYPARRSGFRRRAHGLGSRVLLLLVLFGEIARAGEHGKPRVFWKARVRCGKLAHPEHRRPRRFHSPRMPAIGAQSNLRGARFVPGRLHPAPPAPREVARSST